jgi:hypothetical protein
MKEGKKGGMEERKERKERRYTQDGSTRVVSPALESDGMEEKKEGRKEGRKDFRKEGRKEGL